MDAQIHHFTDLHRLIGEVYSLFEKWEQEGLFKDDVMLRAFYLLKLATHEWLANLIQHADFEGRKPKIDLQASQDMEGMHCIIVDNSAGFDLEGYLREAPSTLQALPERGMGLLILKACTQQLHYSQPQPYLNRLSFTVSADQDPWLSIQF